MKLPESIAPPMQDAAFTTGPAPLTLLLPAVDERRTKFGRWVCLIRSSFWGVPLSDPADPGSARPLGKVGLESRWEAAS